MNHRGAFAYRTVQITTSDPIELIAMLLEAAIRFSREAKVAHEANDRARFGERINRSHAIVEHLALAVDDKADPLLAKRLLSIYEFCMYRLLLASSENAPSRLDEVERALAPLADAWRTIAQGKRNVA